MSTFLYFSYYRLSQWSKKRDENLHVFLTVTWTTLTLISNLVTLCALITIYADVDAISIWLSPSGNKYLGAARLAPLGIIVWLGLKIFHVHEKAFSQEMIKKYEKAGCKSWWVVTYYFASYIIMGVTVWFAGTHLGLHE